LRLKNDLVLEFPKKPTHYMDSLVFRY